MYPIHAQCQCINKQNIDDYHTIINEGQAYDYSDTVKEYEHKFRNKVIVHPTFMLKTGRSLYMYRPVQMCIIQSDAKTILWLFRHSTKKEYKHKI